MDYEFSLHAQEAMVERGIPLAIVQQVLDAPDQILPDAGLQVYQSQVDFNGKPYLVRVFVNDSVTPMRVVTLYRTSQISKYWK